MSEELDSLHPTRIIHKDPTPNVQNMFRAAVERMDVLREAETRRLNEAMLALKELVGEHEKFNAAEVRHVSETATLRAEHAKEMNEKESARLDAILESNAQAVNTASDKAAIATQALAATTASLRETTSVALSTARVEMATATAEAARTVDGRITSLEKANARGEGRQLRDDPVLMDLVEEMRKGRTAAAQHEGVGSGMNDLWLKLTAVAGLAAVLLHTFWK